MLVKLKVKIKKAKLHQGDPLEPVDISPLLQDLTYYFGRIPDATDAYLARFTIGRRRHKDIALHERLYEIDQAARRRYALVHEWAHAFLKHKGDFFPLGCLGIQPTPFDLYLDEIQEQQCVYSAAFVLIPPEVFLICRGMTEEEVALKLVIPTDLIAKRLELLKRHNM
jgi:uncharacterized protein DUF955